MLSIQQQIVVIATPVQKPHWLAPLMLVLLTVRDHGHKALTLPVLHTRMAFEVLGWESRFM